MLNESAEPEDRGGLLYQCPPGETIPWVDIIRGNISWSTEGVSEALAWWSSEDANLPSVEELERRKILGQPVSREPKMKFQRYIFGRYPPIEAVAHYVRWWAIMRFLMNYGRELVEQGWISGGEDMLMEGVLLEAFAKLEFGAPIQESREMMVEVNRDFVFDDVIREVNRLFKRREKS